MTVDMATLDERRAFVLHILYLSKHQNLSYLLSCQNKKGQNIVGVKKIEKAEPWTDEFTDLINDLFVTKSASAIPA